MEEIEKIFNRDFANWEIQLPLDDIAQRRAGTIQKAGWTIRYLFGTDGDSEYLDYYAVHHMTNDRHVRIYADGRSEGLETPSEFIVYSKDADAEAGKQAEEEFQTHNIKVYEVLRKKGFAKRRCHTAVSCSLETNVILDQPLRFCLLMLTGLVHDHLL